MNKKKALIIFGGLAVTSAAVYFIFRKKPYSKVGAFIRTVESKVIGEPVSSEDEVITTTGTSFVNDATVTASTTGCSSYRTESFPLSKCMKGSKVKDLQKFMNKLYSDTTGIKLTEDGYFGPKTENATVVSIGSKVVRESDFNQMQSAYKAISTL